MTLQEGVLTATITIPPGHYNKNSFMTILISLLNTNSPNRFTYAITMNNEFSNTNNGFMYFTVSGNGGVQPDFIFTDYLYEQYGFNANSTVSFVSDALTSTNVVNFIPEQTLYIKSSLVKTRSNNSNGVLQELFASNAQPYQCISYQCTELEAKSKEINDAKTNSFSIVLQNEGKEVINLNGRNMLLTLLLYKKDDIYDKAKSFMKYLVLNNN